MVERIAASLLFASLVVGCTEASPDVFDATVLHKIEITVDSAHLNQLATDLENRVPCTIVYDGEEVANAGIRQKGNTLVELDKKPSFSVRFDEFDDKADLQGLNKILLNNSKQDPTFSRSRIGAVVHARAGLPAERVAHAQVTFNGDDKGIYVVVEAVDKDFLRAHFGEVNDEGNLYEGPCCDDFVVNPDALQLEDEKKDGRTRDDLTALINVLQAQPDATFASVVDQQLDLDHFIKVYALEAVLGHWDGFAFSANNYYMYNNPADGRFVFIPHGMDRIVDDPAFDVEQAPKTLLAQRVRAIADLDTQFHTEMKQLGSSAWNEAAIMAVIDQTATLLHSAGSGTETKEDVADFDANVTDLRNIVTIRSAK